MVLSGGVSTICLHLYGGRIPAPPLHTVSCQLLGQKLVLQTNHRQQSVFTITEKAPIRAFSWLKAPTSVFTYKTLLRHYAKQELTHPR